MRRLPILLLAILPSCGLLGCASPREQYVKADRATYESIAPWVKQKADEDIPEDHAKLGDLRAWDLRIKAAEGEFNQ